MLISHEIPKCLFELSRKFNDYPYVLGHLIKLDSDYKKFYKEELKHASYSILDNSAFELGKSIPFEELISVARELRPSHLVLPDTVHDKNTTLKNSIEFFSQYESELRELNITPIGVVQGDTFVELYECISRYISCGIHSIAIPFDCIANTDYSIVRFQFFRWLINQIGEVGMRGIHFHFLGIQNPQELLLYSGLEKSYIYSIDSSSPILHGVAGNRFTEWGTNEPKPKIKLADNLNIDIDNVTWEKISNNIQHFRNYSHE
jgi:hypothetical protein